MICKQPDMIIQGGPALKYYHILSDKRHIITKDSNNNVAVYDVLQVIFEIINDLNSISICIGSND